MAYYNTGDWVENSTVLVEHYDGRMELVSRCATEQPSSVRELELVG